MPLAPALAGATPLLGVAALLNDDANSSFVVAVTAAGGSVSIVDGRSQVRASCYFLFSFFAPEDIIRACCLLETLERKNCVTREERRERKRVEHWLVIGSRRIPHAFTFFWH